MARDPDAIQGGNAFPLLTSDDLAQISKIYMADRLGESAACPPSPLRANDHAGLPASVIAVAGHDPLRIEGIAFAQKLLDAGNSVRLLCFDTMFHPFLGFLAVSRGARSAYDAMCEEYRKLIWGRQTSDASSQSGEHGEQA